MSNIRNRIIALKHHGERSPRWGGLDSISFAQNYVPKNAKLLEFCTPPQTLTPAPANTYQSTTCAKFSNFALVNEVLENRAK